jgi:beta-glucosidase
MPQATFNFPSGFLWGCATSSFQVEGNNQNNDWAVWETQPGHVLNDDRSGLACDWWGGRWREDFDRAKETGQNAHRFSIEWSRVQPTPDRWDEDAIERYRTILRGLRERGITAMVNFHHFCNPLWLAERGAWENDETPLLFAKYVRKMTEALQEYCSLWMTINEPNVYAFISYLEGVYPPGKRDLNAAFHVLANLVRGHALAYHEIHAVQREARVGLALSIRPMEPAGPLMFLDKIPAGIAGAVFNNAFPDALVDGKLRLILKNINIPEAAHTQDYLGVNYYSMDMIRFHPFRVKDRFTHRFYPKGAELSEHGFMANAPQGMHSVLKWARRYNLPILVTENGIEDSDGRLRAQFLIEHIHQMWRGVNMSWPIKGYFHWSLVDNFEWERGWTQRFGLWGLDIQTQQRIRRPSVDAYAAICTQNGIAYETVEKYAPQILAKLYP